MMEVITGTITLGEGFNIASGATLAITTND